MTTLTRRQLHAGGAAARWLKALVAAPHIACERRDLADLPDHILDDIGVTQAQARRESRRAWWDLPATRI